MNQNRQTHSQFVGVVYQQPVANSFQESYVEDRAWCFFYFFYLSFFKLTSFKNLRKHDLCGCFDEIGDCK
jgi:hypothetical protein